MDNTVGLIFHIIHGSFVDGYGVRTTVFLKGCPLKCIWCCNPEGQQGHPEIKLLSSVCDGCGRCVEICPRDVLRLDGSRPIVVNHERCTLCRDCEKECPQTPQIIRVGWLEDTLIFNVESTGALNPERIVIEATKILGKKVDEFVDQLNEIKFGEEE